MRNSVATYKESLSRIANDVLDAAEELEIPQTSAPVSGPRISQRSSRFTPPNGTPVANGTDPGTQHEIAKYKADIQKLQASEAEIKALSFNYAAILKEKEGQLSKLREENGSLRKTLEAKDAAGRVTWDESPKSLSNNLTVTKGTVDRSSIGQQRDASQGNSCSGNHFPIYSISKQDGYSNGGTKAVLFDALQHKNTNSRGRTVNSQGKAKEHKDLPEELRSLAEVQASDEAEIKGLKAQLDNECQNASTIKLKLQEECKLNECLQRELHDLKMEKEMIFIEMKELQKELNEKISELGRLQSELNQRDMEEESNESHDHLRNTILTLEKENAKLKTDKNELEAYLKLHMKSSVEKTGGNDLDSMDRNSDKLDKAKEVTTLSMQKLEETLKDTYKERDKAKQELARLKQHLLDKELEDSEKMDEDSKVIEELRETTEYQRAHIFQLEKALRHEAAKMEDLKKAKSIELQKSNDVVNELNERLASCMGIVHSKNVELHNLQTALGQFYAESEAKERLRRDLAAAREESTRLSESLKIANQRLEMSEREKEETFAKLSQYERLLSDGKHTIEKLEEDNKKLRSALEQSMMRLNRMSLDSDNSVDRRIVIKLLVTYFQKNHSKEVLDLMVRMLGFSEEDKQRIGFAQHAAGKSVVRGVLGLPRRVVGGIWGGSSPEDSSLAAPENQSFSDLWVEFLLKETEERERRESQEAARMSSSSRDRATSTTSTSIPEHRTNFHSTVGYPSTRYSADHFSSPLATKQNQPFVDAEFATVPLVSVSPSTVSDFSGQPPY